MTLQEAPFDIPFVDSEIAGQDDLPDQAQVACFVDRLRCRPTSRARRKSSLGYVRTDEAGSRPFQTRWRPAPGVDGVWIVRLDQCTKIRHRHPRCCSSRPEISLAVSACETVRTRCLPASTASSPFNPAVPSLLPVTVSITARGGDGSAELPLTRDPRNAVPTFSIAPGSSTLACSPERACLLQQQLRFGP